MTRSGVSSICTMSNCRQPGSSESECRASSRASARKSRTHSAFTSNSATTTKPCVALCMLKCSIRCHDVCPSRCLRGLAERTLLHLATQRDNIEIAFELDILEANDGVLGDRALEPDVMREPDRQAADRKALRCRDRIGPDRVAAFAVEHLAGLEVALGGRHGVAAEFLRRTRRLAAKHGRQYAHAGFEAD